MQILIKGIRSFSPDNQAVIIFHKPLTLIVGANGAGKTVGHGGGVRRGGGREQLGDEPWGG